jgi:plastocyanin
MNKSMVIFTVAVLLMLVGGCTQPAPAHTAATPAPTAPQATVATPPPVPATGSVSPTLPAPVSDNIIRITKKGFDPASITVRTGSTVRWINYDSTTDPALYNPTHRISLETIKTSPLLSPQQGWSWIFDKPGSYEYSDMIHPTLKGTVIVE